MLVCNLYIFFGKVSIKVFEPYLIKVFVFLFMGLDFFVYFG